MISKITYNDDLYIVGEPITITDTVQGVIYVPLDKVNEWKELNEGKSIIGYNYNVKRMTQDLFLPTVTTGTSTDYNVTNLFDGQICKEITINKTMHRGTSNNINLITLPFDVSVKEIKDTLKDIPLFVLMADDVAITSPVLANGTYDNGLFIRSTKGRPDEYIIKAGRPIVLSLDIDNPTHTLTPYTLKFKNKKIDLKNNLCAEKVATEVYDDERKGVDGWYFVGSIVKQKANATGKSTATQAMVVASQGLGKVIVATGSLNAYSAQFEYRGVVPSLPTE